jgi:stress-induced morphogen
MIRRMTTELGPLGSTIRSKLAAAFSPTVLDVLNESHMHSVPKGSETHFKVVVVSSRFENQSLVERHRAVNALLREEFETKGLHALSIVAKTPQQWEASARVPESPTCRGGSKKG